VCISARTQRNAEYIGIMENREGITIYMEKNQNEIREKAVLVGVQLPAMSDSFFESSLAELTSLADTAGADVVGTLTQKRNRPDTVTYIGKGKVDELKAALESLEPDLIIFDGELSPIQLRNLESILDTKIIDRTALILDIFALRAKSREGILQVELARLQYKLPRLTGRGIELSRQGGGIGSRGAGEQKLELDRRHIRRRIEEIQRHLEDVTRTRELHRAERLKSNLKIVSLVGYTNAGKSSLFNTLYARCHPQKGVQVEAENKLFKTLDITTRKITLESKRELLISDTVGFIQNLPHKLVAAFRSTLEETVQADLLLHVIDASNPERDEQIKTVEDVLEELGARHVPVINVYNKADLLDIPPVYGQDGALVSAVTGNGIEKLLQHVEGKLFGDVKDYQFSVPYQHGAFLSKLHQWGEVLQTEESEQEWNVTVRLTEAEFGKIRKDVEKFAIEVKN
jgi:GTPase